MILNPITLPLRNMSLCNLNASAVDKPAISEFPGNQQSLMWAGPLVQWLNYHEIEGYTT